MPRRPISYCDVNDCDLRVGGRGVCRKHYWRMRLTGTTDDPTPPRNQSPCAVDDCGRPARSRGWCATHYTRWQVTGDPTVVLKHKSATRPQCKVDDCDRPAAGAGYCDSHYRNWRRNGTPLRPPLSQRYDAVHDRLRRAKGPAANHTCVACPSPAKEWAYTHDDPEPLTERVHNGGGKWVWVIYSPDLSRYQPMCVPCHRAFDLKQKRKGAAA